MGMNYYFANYGGTVLAILIFLIIYVGIFGGIIYYIAKKFNRNPFRWILAGLFFNYIGAIAILFYIGQSGRIEEDEERRTIVIGFVLAFIIQALILTR